VNVETKFEELTGRNFTEVYNKFKPKMLHNLRRYNNDNLDDLVEDAFIQALLYSHTFNKELSSVQTWIWTIAENKIKADFKRNKIKTISIDIEVPDNHSYQERIPFNDESYLIEEQKIFTIKADIIKKVIYSLEEKFKIVLIMREFEGMTYNEMAEELNINLSTLKSRIKKGRRLVKKKVAQKFRLLENN
jgi:RNA polymerase sigma-70 factor (ECF subfamily)